VAWCEVGRRGNVRATGSGRQTVCMYTVSPRGPAAVGCSWRARPFARETKLETEVRADRDVSISTVLPWMSIKQGRRHAADDDSGLRARVQIAS
jgi:hypothetical protein